MAIEIYATNFRMENHTAYIKIEVVSWDGHFHLEVGVKNPQSRQMVLKEATERLLLLFRSATLALEQAPLSERATQ